MPKNRTATIPTRPVFFTRDPFFKLDGKQAHHHRPDYDRDKPTMARPQPDTAPSPHPRHTPKTEKDPFINAVLQPLAETRKVKNRKL